MIITRERDRAPCQERESFISINLTFLCLYCRIERVSEGGLGWVFVYFCLFSSISLSLWFKIAPIMMKLSWELKRWWWWWICQVWFYYHFLFCSSSAWLSIKTAAPATEFTSHVPFISSLSSSSSCSFHANIDRFQEQKIIIYALQVTSYWFTFCSSQVGILIDFGRRSERAHPILHTMPRPRRRVLLEIIRAAKGVYFGN